MESRDLHPASRPALSKRWSIAVLALVLLFDVWYRAHTFEPLLGISPGVRLWPVMAGSSEPLDCDEAAYAYIGHRMLRGDVMYRDLTENKPPLGYWIYAAAVALGGYNELAIRLLPLPFVLGTIALVWWIAELTAGPFAACIAAVVYTLLSTDPYLYGNGSNMEHFMNFFSVASLALVILAWRRQRSWPLFAAGVCLGAATLVKQVAILPAAAYAAGILGRRERPPCRLSSLILLGAGLAAAIGLAVLVLAAQGAGAMAYEDIMLYGRALATDTLPDPNAPSSLIRWLTGNADPSGRLPWPFGSTKYLVWWATGSWPLWLAAVPCVGYSLFGRGGPAGRRLVGGWTLTAALQVTLPGLYWQHYYLLPAPGVALVVASALADCAGGIRRQAGAPRGGLRRAGTRLLAASLLALAVVSVAVMQWRAYLLVPPQELTVRYKGGGQWVVLRSLGEELARRSGGWPDASLYVWGWQSPLHFYGRLDGVTRHFFVDNLLRDQAERNHRLIRPRIEEIVRTLRARPPALIFAGYAPFPELRAFLREKYLLSGLVPASNGLGLWVRRDHFADLERSTATGAGRSGSRDAGQGLVSGRCDGRLVALPQSAHDGLPGLARGIGTGGLGHRSPPVVPLHQGEQFLGEPRGGFVRLDQYARLAGPDGISDPAGPQRGHGHARGHGLEDDVAERFRKAGEGEDVPGRVMVGQVLSDPIAGEPRDRTHALLQLAP